MIDPAYSYTCTLPTLAPSPSPSANNNNNKNNEACTEFDDCKGCTEDGNGVAAEGDTDCTFIANDRDGGECRLKEKDNHCQVRPNNNHNNEACCCYHNPGQWEYFCTTPTRCAFHGDTCKDASNCESSCKDFDKSCTELDGCNGCNMDGDGAKVEGDTDCAFGGKHEGGECRLKDNSTHCDHYDPDSIILFVLFAVLIAVLFACCCCICKIRKNRNVMGTTSERKQQFQNQQQAQQMTPGQQQQIGLQMMALQQQQVQQITPEQMAQQQQMDLQMMANNEAWERDKMVFVEMLKRERTRRSFLETKFSEAELKVRWLQQQMEQQQVQQITPDYDPKEYANLDVSPDIAELFAYILRYKPQEVELETSLKCFIPDYIPAVGEMDR